MNNKIKNIEGQKFNHFTVLSKVKDDKRKSSWLCKCICGKEVVVRLDTLQNGCKKSCGCRRYESYSIGINNPGWKGYGKIHGRVWCHIKRDANRRKLVFDITIQDAWEIFEKQNGKCAISGVNLNFSERHSDYLNCTASLDRINSSKGYTKDNVQWVHKKVNRLKWDLETVEFLEWCKTISNYNRDITSS